MFSYGLTIITHLAKQVYVPDRKGFPRLCQFMLHTYLTKVDSPDVVPVLIRGRKPASYIAANTHLAKQVYVPDKIGFL